MTVTPIDGVRYWFDHAQNAFIAPSRPSLTLTRSRDALVAGVDKPNLSNTGPYTVTNWTERYPTGTSNLITISTPGVYYGLRFWARVRASVEGVIFRECWFAGADPASSSASFGCLENYGSNPRPITLEDSIIDPSPWVTVQGRTLNPYAIGLHGGNFKAYRTAILNVHDGWSWLGPDANATATVVAAQEHLLQQCLIHKGFYANDVYPPSDGQPHGDGLQTHFGKNLTLWGSTIGGVRDIAGYNTWPGGYNSGDDHWNAELMLQQEVSSAPYALIENVLIKENWLSGGKSTINHSAKPAYPNDWSTCQIINNRFGRRGSNWGIALKANGPGQPAYRDTSYSDAGYYIIRSPSMTTPYAGNVIEDTGEPVPIQRGS